MNAKVTTVILVSGRNRRPFALEHAARVLRVSRAWRIADGEPWEFVGGILRRVHDTKKAEVADIPVTVSEEAVEYTVTEDVISVTETEEATETIPEEENGDMTEETEPTEEEGEGVSRRKRKNKRHQEE